MNSIHPDRLSDSDLVSEVARLARSERQATAMLIAHLSELYGRRLHERAGYSSLFTYCVGVLGLSESAAYDRMKAAKVARRYPSVLGLLTAGRLNLTTVRLVAPHLTRDNHRQLLDEVCGKGKRQVLEVLARRFPQADVPPSIRTLPTKTTAPSPPTLDSPPCAGIVASAVETTFVPKSWPPPREPVKPLSPERYQFTFTGGSSAREKLELAQDLLRHAIPTGDPAQVFERALDVMIEDLVKRKFAATERPRASRERADESNVPAEVKRAVYIRDRGRCAYVSPNGHRCGARGFVEFHHIDPRAAGGKGTADNISLRCRAHNRYEAEVFYGPMREYLSLDSAARVTRDTFSFWNESGTAAERAGAP